MVTARYLKIFALIWYLAGAIVLANNKQLGKVFGIIAIVLFGFNYTDIRTISFDKGYAKAINDIRSFIPKSEKLITLDNSNLFCEYYLPEYTCLVAVDEYGEILRLPNILKNINLYSEEASEVTFMLSIFNAGSDSEDCLTYYSLYRRGQNLNLCKADKSLAEKLLRDSLNLRLKNY